jgi:hypothetical protein
MGSIVLQVPRVRNGQPTTAELFVRYSDDEPGQLPRMVILADYSPRTGVFRSRRCYKVGEIAAAGGRAFLLYRDSDAVESDPDRERRYGCFISYSGETSDLCECKAHAAYGRCRHVQALKVLLAAGHIDRVEAGRPADPVTVESTYHTDPERSGQVFADAMVVAPF